ncbi:MAG: hypothetical protein M5U34_18475 [Chloroflexi bacterium]|nr:hypothetical protein [Chloroflexota bacterium]
MDDNLITFRLEEKEQDGGEWDYRPGGVRTLKIEIKTNVDQGPLRLRWQGAKRRDGLVCAFRWSS